MDNSGYKGGNPNNNPVCNMKVTATCKDFPPRGFILNSDPFIALPDQGKTTTVTITDRCTGCALTDLDFSPTAFQDLADESVGRISGMTWVWDV